MEEIVKKIFCNRCNGITNHGQKAKFLYSDTETFEEKYSVTWNEEWYILQCMGCNNITVEKIESFSEEVDEKGRPYKKRIFYPERNAKFLIKKSYENIPEKLEMIYSEIIDSYNKSCFLLCSIGLRTLLEAICVDKGINGKNLINKIENSTFITDNIKKNLHGIRYLGNDATHEFIYPSKEDLELTIKILEDVLNTIYDLDYKSTLMYNKF